MRPNAPFDQDDLAQLDAFLRGASRVVTMNQARATPGDPRLIGMRHDVDNSLAPSVAMAEWEAERGYRSTYFILHTAPYWQQKDTLAAALEIIHDCGHEIGFHVNAISEAIRTGGNPIQIAAEALGELREYGYPVNGVCAHGDDACYVHEFVNDEIFTESPRPRYGDPIRTVGGIRLHPVSRKAFALDYDPNWLPRGQTLSDSGGRWAPQQFAETTVAWPDEGQLHILIHPDWWKQAFLLEMAA